MLLEAQTIEKCQHAREKKNKKNGARTYFNGSDSTVYHPTPLISLPVRLRASSSSIPPRFPIERREGHVSGESDGVGTARDGDGAIWRESQGMLLVQGWEMRVRRRHASSMYCRTAK